MNTLTTANFLSQCSSGMNAVRVYYGGIILYWCPKTNHSVVLNLCRQKQCFLLMW